MMEYKDLKALGVALGKAKVDAPVAYSFEGENYSYSQLQDTFRKELNEIGGDFYAFEANKLTIYKLMGEILDEILPISVVDRYGSFAEMKTVPQGTEVYFKRKTGKNRAKQFVTYGALAGLYDVFKLDTENIHVQMGALTVAAQVGFEEWLDGNADFNDLLDAIQLGLDEKVYTEIGNALNTYIGVQSGVAFTNNKNKKVVAGDFDEAKFDQLIAVTESFGRATIYCTYEFATTMLPKDSGWASDSMKAERWANGYVANYKGHRVIILPQSFDNELINKQINPQVAYIIPGDDKPVKLAFEGQTIVDEFKNYDRSREVQVYKKFGIAIVTNPGMTAYVNTSIPTAYTATPTVTTGALKVGDLTVESTIVNDSDHPVNTHIQNPTSDPVNTKEVSG